MRRLLVIAAAVGLAVATAGCGESTQVTLFKQGQYQGKPDKRPWDNDQFKGDKAAWGKIRQGAQSRPERVRAHLRQLISIQQGGAHARPE